MAIVNIQSELQTPEWRYPGSVGYLRIYASQTFYGTDGEQVTQGQVGSPNWYQQYECPVTDGFITIPVVTLQSTTDSTAPSARYTAQFFTSAGAQVNPPKLSEFAIDPFGIQQPPPFSSVMVATGGTTAANGIYTYRGTTGGSPYYNLVGQSDSTTLFVIKNVSSLWKIYDVSGTLLYTSTNNANYPWSVAGWTVTSGPSPAPNVSEDILTIATTWEALSLFNQAFASIVPAFSWPGPFYNAAQTDQLIQSRIGSTSTPFASSLVVGKTALDVDPASAQFPIAVGVNSPLLHPLVSVFYKVLSTDYANSLSGAITSIGATPTLLYVTENTTVSTALVVPSTLTLEFVNGAEVVKAGSGAITFQGHGVADPESTTPIFSGFAVGNILWSGTAPLMLSSSLWADTLLSDKLQQAIGAVAGKNTTIVAYPGQMATKTTLTIGLSLYLTQGTYTNTIPTIGSGTKALFILQDNTTVYGDGAATILQESSNNNPGFFAGSSVQAGPFDGANSNIYIRDLYLTGNSGTATDSSQSAIFLGNVQNAHVERITFNKTHGFAVYVGAFSTSGNFADGVWITDNNCIGLQTQQIGTVGGNNVHIARNTFSKPEIPLFYVTDAVTTSSTTVTSVTGGFNQAFVSTNVLIQKLGHADFAATILTVTDTHTIILDAPVPYTATGVSLQQRGPFGAVIDIEPNALTWGSEDIEIVDNIFDLRISGGNCNAITVQKGYSGGTRQVRVDGNIILGAPQFVNFWTSAEVNTTLNTITIYNHGLQNGELCLCQGTLPSGLGSNFQGYAIYVDQNTIKMALSYAYAMVGQAIPLGTTGGLANITPLGGLSNGIQMFSTENSVVSNNFVAGCGQLGIDTEFNYRLMVRDNTLRGVGIGSISNVNSDFIDNSLNYDFNLPITQSGAIGETDPTTTIVTTTSGSPTVLVTTDQSLVWYVQNLPININGVDYTIARRLGSMSLTLTGNVAESTITKTFGTADVNTGADTITITAHGFNSGAGVSLSTTGTLPAGLTASMFVIRIDANTIQLAASFLGATTTVPVPVNITTTGSGTGTIINNLAVIRWSSNRYSGNYVSNGNINLSGIGSSRFYSQNSGKMVAVSFAPPQITSNQNDYAPTVIARRYDLNTDASRNITGLTWAPSPNQQAPIEGQRVTFYNAGSHDIVLKNETTSTAAYRFHNITGADITIPAGGFADLEYVASLSRWVVNLRGDLTTTSTAIDAAQIADGSVSNAEYETLNGVTSAIQTQIDLKAPLISPSFTTPALGVATGTSLAATGLIKSSSATAGIGYATGAGGSVTQSTDKTTTVASNTITTAITLNNAALGAATIVSFTFTNTTIAALDTVICEHSSVGTSGAYTVNAFPGAGSAIISVRNNTAGSLSEAIVLRVTVVKSVSS